MTMFEKDCCSARLSKIDPGTLRLVNYTGLPRHLFEKAAPGGAWCTTEACACDGSFEVRPIRSSGVPAAHLGVLEVRP